MVPNQSNLYLNPGLDFNQINPSIMVGVPPIIPEDKPIDYYEDLLKIHPFAASCFEFKNASRSIRVLFTFFMLSLYQTIVVIIIQD